LPARDAGKTSSAPDVSRNNGPPARAAAVNTGIPRELHVGEMERSKQTNPLLSRSGLTMRYAILRFPLPPSRYPDRRREQWISLPPSLSPMEKYKSQKWARSEKRRAEQMATYARRLVRATLQSRIARASNDPTEGASAIRYARPNREMTATMRDATRIPRARARARNHRIARVTLSSGRLTRFNPFTACAGMPRRSRRCIKPLRGWEKGGKRDRRAIALPIYPR